VRLLESELLVKANETEALFCGERKVKAADVAAFIFIE